MSVYYAVLKCKVSGIEQEIIFEYKHDKQNSVKELRDCIFNAVDKWISPYVICEWDFDILRMVIITW